MNDDNLKVRKARQADYIFWLQKDWWNPPEASILLAGYEPEEFPDGDIDFSSLAGDVDGIHRLIIESIKSKQIPVKNSPADWITWFTQTGLNLPSELHAVRISQADSEATAAPVETESTSGGVARAQEKPWLVSDPNDPTPTQSWYTPARYFARQLIKDDSTLLLKKQALADKVSKSLTKVSIFKRGGKKPFVADTVLKAFSNVNLG